MLKSLEVQLSTGLYLFLYTFSLSFHLPFTHILLTSSGGSCCHWLSPGEVTHIYDPWYFLTSDRWQDDKYKRCQRRVTDTREGPKLCLKISSRSSLLSLQAAHLKGAAANLSAASLIHCLASPIRGPGLCQHVAKQPCLGLSTKISATKASGLTFPFLHTGKLAFSYHTGLSCSKNSAADDVSVGCVFILLLQRYKQKAFTQLFSCSKPVKPWVGFWCGCHSLSVWPAKDHPYTFGSCAA